MALSSIRRALLLTGFDRPRESAESLAEQGSVIACALQAMPQKLVGFVFGQADQNGPFLVPHRKDIRSEIGPEIAVPSETQQDYGRLFPQESR